MKRVLIVTPSLRHGGTNRSLWNFLNTKSNDMYTVDIMVMEHIGPYKERFERFNLLPENPVLASIFSLPNVSGVLKIKKILYKILFKIAFRSKKSKIFTNVAKNPIFGKYDIVVAFQEGMATEFVSYLPIKKRIAWVRCDYSNYLKFSHRTDESEIYDKYDKIVCVSKYTAGVFMDYYPQYRNKVMSIYNIIDTNGIIETSKYEICDENFKNDKFTLVSVGRMDPVKRFKYIPEIARKLKENKCDFRWFIIGDGGTEMPVVRSEIENQKVSECVILLGAKENPYPYIVASDVLVCPSITEACPNVINEAKILRKVVVAADFPSAPEYIEHGTTGEIVSIEDMADCLLKIYGDTVYYQKLKANISSFIYDNEVIRRQLDAIFS